MTMLIIDNKVISPEIFEEEFVCNLDACKGACCWEGDYGAPLEIEELDILEELYPKIKPFLTSEGIEAIEEQGVAVYIPEEKEYGTTLIDNAACAYLTYENNGIAKCGIEKAYEADLIDYAKPVSCHLYPIRVEQLDNSSFQKLEYDRWDICSAACDNGAKLNVPVYKFLEGPLIRKYGADFYEQLEHMAEHLMNPE
ncbi:DUF3109 family protein [Aureispira anguillae]|uniref:DUF3109 family protein n=2 Tax=Aureispira anguillae TaxID=2864201 RepID=A0A915YIG8_9BACT|nr:DUF3109 family protein [Aureispira anguillae]BDS13576.1 DUF3109 family protein [Aureispira anguillae]